VTRRVGKHFGTAQQGTGAEDRGQKTEDRGQRTEDRALADEKLRDQFSVKPLPIPPLVRGGSYESTSLASDVEYRISWFR
jgi:hypothetical protein